MKFTQGQLRQIVGISKETFRHWKTVVSGLSREHGHSPCFAPSDIFATAILRKVCSQTGIPIGRLKVVSDDIFDICDVASWIELESQRLVIDLKNDDCWLQREFDPESTMDTLILCSLAPIVSQLRQELSHSQYFGLQGYLAFPTPLVGGGEEKQGQTR